MKYKIINKYNKLGDLFVMDNSKKLDKLIGETTTPCQVSSDADTRSEWLSELFGREIIMNNVVNNVNDELFKIQIFSDLHVELNNTNFLKKIIPKAPYVALLGDIGYPNKKGYRNTIEFFSKLYKKVFIIADNHEYYKQIYNDVNNQILKICEQFDNVIFMNRTSYDIDDFKILGCTLWSYIPNENSNIVSKYLNDYNLIHYLENDKIYKFNVDFQNSLHKTDIEWLISEVNNSDKPLIILTHHAPSFKNTSSKRYEGLPTNCAFATDLEYLFNDKIKLWGYGHTHYCNKQNINGTLLVSNQYGYASACEHINFSYDSAYELNKKNEK
jgi:predicted MPP superfamily phosphohydrolase